MDLLYAAAARRDIEAVRTIVAANEPHDHSAAGRWNAQPVIVAATRAGQRSDSLAAAYGESFAKATFLLVVARAYSHGGRLESAKTHYRFAAERYESAARELSARAKLAADDQRTREFFAALGNVVIPILAGAAAHAQAEMMASQTGSFGVGVVTYPVIPTGRRGDYGAHYQHMSRESYFSALQIYLIIECYELSRSPSEMPKCREMEKITGSE